MGFWDKLFGKGETDEQKLARARQALDDNELTLAVKIVANLEGASADEIRRRARAMSDAQSDVPPEPRPIAHGPDVDDPLHERGPYRESSKPGKKQKRQQQPPRHGPPEVMPTLKPEGDLQIFAVGADGSQRIGDVVLNAPVSDDDGRVRSTDGLDVAARVLKAVSEHPLDHREHAFIDAVLLFARAGKTLPRMGEPKRRALAELIVAADTGDPGKVIDAIRAGFEGGAAETTTWFAPLVATKPGAARAVGVMAAATQIDPTEELVWALLPNEPALVASIVEAYPAWAGQALILAEDANVEVPGLAARWRDWKSVEEHQQRLDWLALTIRREARRDLDAAIALEQELVDLEGTHFAATHAIASRLDAERLRKILDAQEPSVDEAGWFLGAVRSGRTEILDRWIDAFTAYTYDPYAYFETVLAACIETRDVERTRKLLAKAGPTGWQVACAAWNPLSRYPSSEMLDVLYERHAPSFVAGRAIGRGAIPLGAGKMVIQPAWLDFRDPHPIETLALVVALGPSWNSPSNF